MFQKTLVCKLLRHYRKMYIFLFYLLIIAQSISQITTKKDVYTHVLWVDEDSKNIYGVIWCVAETNSILCKLVQSLLKN